jgi:2-(1,2-epoxy-1,2-dihydrophenyl)acetyl-CoA isomerase
VSAVGYETIELDVDAGVARLTLNRPNEANAIDARMAAELRDAAIAIRFDPGVRTVLLAARGKLFCGGGDLQVFRDAGAGAGGALAGIAADLHVALSTFAEMDAPVVAAVRGAAGGAGMSLVAGADIVVAGERAKFTMGYTAVGLTPDGGSTFFLSRVVGLRRAMDLVLTNRVLDARTAEEWGLVTRVVPDERVDDEASALAATLAAGPTGALGLAKRLLLDGASAGLAEAFNREAVGISGAASTPDGREGIAAFVEKRAPQFGVSPTNR